MLTVGDINADIMAIIPQYPQRGGEALSQTAEFHAGGSAANTALVLARFGLDATLMGRVGTDPLGEYVLEELEEAGVDLALVERDRGAMTGTMFIAVTPDGEHTIFGHRGANVNLTSIPLKNVTWPGLTWVHISGYALLEGPQRVTAVRVLEEAATRGITVSLDVGVCTARQAGDYLRKLLPQTNVLFQNLEEARALTGRSDVGEASKALLEKGVGTVVIKLGKKGCVAADDNSSFQVPAFAVDVVDTTGAGDAFNAGFILAQRWGLGLRPSALLANVLGGLACTALGAGGRLPEPQAARRLIRRTLARSELKGWKEELELLLRSLERSKGK